MQAGKRKRMLVVLLSAALAAGAGGNVFARDGAVILSEEEVPDILAVPEEPSAIPQADEAGLDIVSVSAVEAWPDPAAETEAEAVWAGAQEGSVPAAETEAEAVWAGAQEGSVPAAETEAVLAGAQEAAVPAEGTQTDPSGEIQETPAGDSRTEQDRKAQENPAGGEAEILAVEDADEPEGAGDADEPGGAGDADEPGDAGDADEPGDAGEADEPGDAGEALPENEAEDTEEIILPGSGDAKDGSRRRVLMRSALQFELCYGDQLTGESRKIYDRLVDDWGGGETGNIVYVPDTPLYIAADGTKEISEDIQKAYDAFVYDHPEVFWLREIGIVVGHNSLGRITSVILRGMERYEGAKNEVEEFGEAVQAETAYIEGLLPEGADRYETVKTIHDHICNTTKYDYEEVNCARGRDTAHTAAGIFLKDRLVVCEGYAKAMKILCGQFGIECVLVIGNAGGTDHMWNYVKMDDGNWYLVDATWDDQRDRLCDTYLLAGSATAGFFAAVGDERSIYTDFSDTGLKHFIVPALSLNKYEYEKHSWEEISRTPATCYSCASAQYRCTICQKVKTEITGEKLDHDWGDYVSNNDATWERDGTKTAVCRRGCGEKRTVVDTGTRLTPSIHVSLSSLTLKTGQSTDAVKVTLVRGDFVVSWKSSKPDVAGVGSKGRIKAGKKTGKTVITVKTGSGLSKKIRVTVQKADVKTAAITGLKKNVTLKKGEKLKLSPVIEPVTSLQEVTYSSSDKKTAKVSAKGVITAVRAGTAKIKVRSGEKTFTVTVKVKPGGKLPNPPG